VSTLTFQLEEGKAGRLTEAAREQGVPVEELLRQIAEDYLARQDGFERAAKYVLQKNAELYRRLATSPRSPEGK
jgi:hypothetical protein